MSMNSTWWSPWRALGRNSATLRLQLSNQSDVIPASGRVHCAQGQTAHPFLHAMMGMFAFHHTLYHQPLTVCGCILARSLIYPVTNTNVLGVLLMFKVMGQHILLNSIVYTFLQWLQIYYIVVQTSGSQIVQNQDNIASHYGELIRNSSVALQLIDVPSDNENKPVQSTKILDKINIKKRHRERPGSLSCKQRSSLHQVVYLSGHIILLVTTSTGFSWRWAKGLLFEGFKCTWRGFTCEVSSHLAPVGCITYKHSW